MKADRALIMELYFPVIVYRMICSRSSRFKTLVSKNVLTCPEATDYPRGTVDKQTIAQSSSVRVYNSAISRMELNETLLSMNRCRQEKEGVQRCSTEG